MNYYKKIDYHPHFFEDNFYHVYNRASGNDKLFFSDDNYKYFLNRFKYFLGDILNTYAFCLLPNHFHLLVKPKINESEIVIEKFRKFFISYSMAINKQQSRKGNLFQSNFKRKIIDDENYLIQVIYYIHANPAHHFIKKDFQNYKFSSYRKIIGSSKTSLEREVVLNWFGGIENFVNYHKDFRPNVFNDYYSIEDV